MHILPISNINPSIKFNKFKSSKITHILPYKTEAKNSLALVDKYNLSSKYNINFSGLSPLESIDVDEAFKNVENIIQTSINPSDFDIVRMKSAIKSSDDIKFINSALKKDGITDFLKTGISLNQALDYLKQKGQIILPKKMKPKRAFFVDDLSVAFLEKQSLYNKDKLHDWIDKFQNGSVKFYSYNMESEKVAELQNRLEHLFSSDISIENLQNEPKKETLFPNSDEIKNIIMTSSKEVDVQNRQAFIGIVIKYLNDTLICYSYQTLAKKLKEAYKKIEQYVNMQNKTMDDVLYFIPEATKSYEMINYLYAMENDIDPNKIIYDRNIGGARDRNSIFVILDDCALSGDSMRKAVNIFNMKSYYRFCDYDLVFCPILSTKQAENTAKEISLNQNFGYLPIDRCKIYNPEKIKNGTVKAAILPDEVDILTKGIASGYLDNYGSVIFPYMIPDNSSDLVGYLGEYFLIFSDSKANKALDYQMTKDILHLLT